MSVSRIWLKFIFPVLSHYVGHQISCHIFLDTFDSQWKCLFGAHMQSTEWYMWWLVHETVSESVARRREWMTDCFLRESSSFCRASLRVGDKRTNWVLINFKSANLGPIKESKNRCQVVTWESPCRILKIRKNNCNLSLERFSVGGRATWQGVTWGMFQGWTD